MLQITKNDRTSLDVLDGVCGERDNGIVIIMVNIGKILL